MNTRILVLVLIQILVNGGPVHGRNRPIFYAQEPNLVRESATETATPQTKTEETKNICVSVKDKLLCTENLKNLPSEYKKYLHTLLMNLNQIKESQNHGISYQYYDDQWLRVPKEFADFDFELDSKLRGFKRPLSLKSKNARAWRDMTQNVDTKATETEKRSQTKNLQRQKLNRLSSKLTQLSQISYQYYDDAWLRKHNEPDFVDIEANVKDAANSNVRGQNILRTAEVGSDNQAAFGENYDALVKTAPNKNRRKNTASIENAIDEYIEQYIKIAKNKLPEYLENGLIKKEFFDELIHILKQMEEPEFRNKYLEGFHKVLDEHLEAALEYGKNLLTNKHKAGEISKETFEKKLISPDSLNKENIKVKTVKILLQTNTKPFEELLYQTVIPVDQEGYLIRRLTRELKQYHPLNQKQLKKILDKVFNVGDTSTRLVKSRRNLYLSVEGDNSKSILVSPFLGSKNRILGHERSTKIKNAYDIVCQDGYCKVLM